jgi:hypothetical protein
LSRVFAEPTPADLRWSEIEALFKAAGAEIIAAGVRPGKE